MRLQRVTSSARWIPEIDGLRLIAILAVLLVHVYAETVHRAGRPMQSDGGQSFRRIYLLERGVQLFFVISGFILAQPFVRQHIDGGHPVKLGAFYLRRLTRLEPPYIASLLVYFAAWRVMHRPAYHLTGSLLASLLYAHNYFPQLTAVNFVTWSLEVEIVFYVLAPVFALVFLLRPAWLRRTALCAAVLAGALIPTYAADAAGFFFARSACFFLLGYLLADLRIHQLPRFTHAAWDAVSLVVWPVYFLLLPGPWIRPELVLLLFVALCAAMFGPTTRLLLGWRPVAILGGMCYSIYLMHMLIISGLFSFTRHALVFPSLLLNLLVQWTLLIPAAVLGSLLFYVAIERPCMDPHWPRHLWRRLWRSGNASEPRNLTEQS